MIWLIAGVIALFLLITYAIDGEWRAVWALWIILMVIVGSVFAIVYGAHRLTTN